MKAPLLGDAAESDDEDPRDTARKKQAWGVSQWFESRTDARNRNSKTQTSQGP